MLEEKENLTLNMEGVFQEGSGCAFTHADRCRFKGMDQTLTALLTLQGPSMMSSKTTYFPKRIGETPPIPMKKITEAETAKFLSICLTQLRGGLEYGLD